MEIWSHQERLYEVISTYSLYDDAWCYELTGLTGPHGTGPYLSVVIPDATPVGPFTPLPADRVFLHFGGGHTPWPILRRLLSLVRDSGDLVGEQDEPNAVTGPEGWIHGGRRFAARAAGDESGNPALELHETGAGESAAWVEARVPVGAAEPGSVDQVMVTAHGDLVVPWPVFRRFLAMVGQVWRTR